MEDIKNYRKTEKHGNTLSFIDLAIQDDDLFLFCAF